jgi:hypothetical protein
VLLAWSCRHRRASIIDGAAPSHDHEATTTRSQ